MSDHPVPRKRVRASDEERDAVLSVLQQAHAAGRLSVEELGERQDLALQIRYTDEVSDLVEDLPEGSHLLPTLGAAGAPSPSVRSAVPPPVAASPESVSMSVMSGKTVDIAPGTVLYRNFAWWGGDDIYLGDAMGPGVVITLELHCIMAGHNIYVPEGVRVIDESLAIMAGNDVDGEAKGDGSNGTLVIKGFLWWAGSDVKLQRQQRN
ncbi:DUF1707 domain-containing protein [Tessaracoccus rhinocerotis]|uniref:DUF1707 domain-containing protein n=1 Tax=Tessaracoccus rhinocerotis TaxID=1689449 RepID=A0A553JZG6_9ACTN|nr:DUF1707 domain-containing protein [Tessaracoccus rhinocerotis]TRY17858.1 DUF1707 domain-containing protein [Tessaracoccus rhinocerotis]